MNLDKISKEDLLSIIKTLIVSNINRDDPKGPFIEFAIRRLFLSSSYNNSSMKEISDALLEEIFHIFCPGWDKE